MAKHTLKILRCSRMFIKTLFLRELKRKFDCRLYSKESIEYFPTTCTLTLFFKISEVHRGFSNKLLCDVLKTTSQVIKYAVSSVLRFSLIQSKRYKMQNKWNSIFVHQPPKLHYSSIFNPQAILQNMDYCVKRS